MLTKSQVESYNADGYVTVAGVLPPDEMAELRRVTEEFVDKSRHATDHTDEFLEPGHTVEAPRLRRLKLPENSTWPTIASCATRPSSTWCPSWWDRTSVTSAASST